MGGLPARIPPAHPPPLEIGRFRGMKTPFFSLFSILRGKRKYRGGLRKMVIFGHFYGRKATASKAGRWTGGGVRHSPPKCRQTPKAVATRRNPPFFRVFGGCFGLFGARGRLVGQAMGGQMVAARVAGSRSPFGLDVWRCVGRKSADFDRKGGAGQPKKNGRGRVPKGRGGLYF